MKTFTFYIEWFGCEVEFTDVWNALTNHEQDAVVQIECIDLVGAA